MNILNYIVGQEERFYPTNSFGYNLERLFEALKDELELKPFELKRYIVMDSNAGNFALMQKDPFEDSTFSVGLSYSYMRAYPPVLSGPLAHEMCHIKQFQEGRLDVSDNKIFWEGNLIDVENIPYEELPYENEAMEKEIVGFNMADKLNLWTPKERNRGRRLFMVNPSPLIYCVNKGYKYVIPPL